MKPELRHLARKLLASGLDPKTVAQRTGIPIHSIYKLHRSLGLPPLIRGRKLGQLTQDTMAILSRPDLSLRKAAAHFGTSHQWVSFVRKRARERTAQ